MNRRRILLLCHEDLVPPEDAKGVSDEEIEPVKTEYDVYSTLANHGHSVRVLGVRDELFPIRDALRELRPHVVFNMLEEFRDQAVFDQNIVAYLELLGVPYTGCNANGLFLARDKALSKKILHYHRIRVPRFVTVRRGRKPSRKRGLEFPLIVKSLVEEASTGISQRSIVRSDEKLVERVEFIHERVGTAAIVEEFIEGRELYSGVLGNKRLTVLPTWELLFDEASTAPFIATESAKWDPKYQKRHGVRHGPADIDDDLRAHVVKTSKNIYRRLGLSGYARIDFRLNERGLYFLEANPNPDIAADEELACAAEAAGLSYIALLEKIIRLGIRRAKRLLPPPLRLRPPAEAGPPVEEDS